MLKVGEPPRGGAQGRKLGRQPTTSVRSNPEAMTLTPEAAWLESTGCRHDGMLHTPAIEFAIDASLDGWL